jgi:hypothetical protein
MKKHKILVLLLGVLMPFVLVVVMASCQGVGTPQASAVYVDGDGFVADRGEMALPYSGDETGEKVVSDHGQRAIRLVKDKRLSFPEKGTSRIRLFFRHLINSSTKRFSFAAGDSLSRPNRIDCTCCKICAKEAGPPSERN